MKSVSTATKNAIRRSDALVAIPFLLAEWNLNRYATTTVTNVPSDADEGDPEYFPIESIVEPLRPGQGIVKARVGEARISSSYMDNPDSTRYYVASDKDKYKYWCSPRLSGAGGAITGCAPTIEYGVSMGANKIVVALETASSIPTQYSIQVKRGGSWISVGDESNTSINADGRIELFYSTGGWGSVESDAFNFDTPTDSLSGIRIQVFNLDATGKYFYLIEMGLRKVKDLSGYLQSCSENFEISDRSLIAPFGKASSNQGTLYNL